MLFSRTARQSGASGFFFDGDKGAPIDSINVSAQDASTAINLPSGATFDFDATCTLVVTPSPTLTAAQLKVNAVALKWEAIKAERDRLTQNGGYPLDDYFFHSDAYSLSQQQGLILAAIQLQASGGDMSAPLMATPWYVMGGIPVVMTGSLALLLLPAAMAQQVAIFEAAKAHKAAMEASADPASYDFSGGWPPIYNK